MIRTGDTAVFDLAGGDRLDRLIPVVLWSAGRAPLAVLDGLDLPVLLAGDRVGEIAGDEGRPLSGLWFGYDEGSRAPWGRIGSPDALAQWMGAVKGAPSWFWRSGMRGQHVDVCTQFHGVALPGSWDGGPVLTWETAVITADPGGGPCGMVAVWRYATRAAAHAGHERVVSVLAAAGAAEREPGV